MSQWPTDDNLAPGAELLAPEDIQVSYTVNEAALQADDKRENSNDGVFIRDKQKYQNHEEFDNYDQFSANEVDPPRALPDSVQIETNLPTRAHLKTTFLP